MLMRFVMSKQSVINATMQAKIAAENQPKPTSVQCRVCGKNYRYDKARKNHEKVRHGLDDASEDLDPKPSDDSKSPSTKEKKEKDDKYDYATARLSMGLLLKNFDDAIKEGDGERILRGWKFALPIYRAFNHNKYALAALQPQANVKAILNPREAHWLTWNRTVNNRGGIGNNIYLDLRMEHLINLTKGMLKNLRPNITEKGAWRCSKSIGYVEELLHSVDNDIKVKRPSGYHKVQKSEVDFTCSSLTRDAKGEVFKYHPSTERHYHVFSNFQPNLVQNIDLSALNKWFTHHKKEFDKRGH